MNPSAVHHFVSCLNLRSANPLVVVLIGIDGAGKTTAAHALSKLLETTTPTLLLANYSGRRTMSTWTERTGLAVPPRLLDLTESLIRSANVVMNHLRARRFNGIVIMDRHLHCQQALRTARGLPPGRFLAALTRMLPAADAVIFLDVSPEEAHRRIEARGTDTETLEHLRAYRDGYLRLAEVESTRRVAANRPLLAVLDDLEDMVSGLLHGTEAVPRSDQVEARSKPVRAETTGIPCPVVDAPPSRTIPHPAVELRLALAALFVIH